VSDAEIHGVRARLRAHRGLFPLVAVVAVAAGVGGLGAQSLASADACPERLPSPKGATAHGEAQEKKRRVPEPERGRARLRRTAARPVTRTTPVPILMYHVIGRAPNDAPYPKLYVTRRRFAEHIEHLARRRYNVVTLQQVWDHWHGGPRLPSKPVVVSFDDGSRGWYTHAYPILRRHGWVGTMNLALSHLNGVDLRVRWVQKLIAAGWELDAHTFTHRDLTLLGDRDLRREVGGSRARLRRVFGVPVNFFCYPSGSYDARVIAAVRKAGYLGATTTLEGLAVPGTPFTLRRIRIDGSDRAAALGLKLAGARVEKQKKARSLSRPVPGDDRGA
jgi:peptidoglycan/xylan/chitin deacetylase (PgdA/CDA1 family)